jgi:hypothetical protein
MIRDEVKAGCGRLVEKLDPAVIIVAAAAETIPVRAVRPTANANHPCGPLREIMRKKSSMTDFGNLSLDQMRPQGAALNRSTGTSAYLVSHH